MSNAQILLIIAAALLLLIIVYKFSTPRCPRCRGDADGIVHTFSNKNPEDSVEMHFYECKKCDFSWGHKTARKKNKSPQ